MSSAEGPGRVKPAVEREAGKVAEDQGPALQSVCAQCVRGRLFSAEMRHSWLCPREPRLTLH